MSVLQDLIVKFNSKKNAELYTRIIKEIQSAEKYGLHFPTLQTTIILET